MPYRALVLIGFLWGIVRRPGLTVWVTFVFVSFSLFSISLFNNRPYNVRSQLFPTSFLMVIAAGAASAGMEILGRTRRLTAGVGSFVLVMLSATTAHWYGFITRLQDQQLEWKFLERTVPRLPQQSRLLAPIEWGGRNLDAFPSFLLSRAGKKYEFFDLRLAAKQQTSWPDAADDLIYYQGMFCYFAFKDEPLPVPMTADCQAVHDRYVMEPLFVEDLETQGYSALNYAEPPFHIGFFRLKSRL